MYFYHLARLPAPPPLVEPPSPPEEEGREKPDELREEDPEPDEEKPERGARELEEKLPDLPENPLCAEPDDDLAEPERPDPDAWRRVREDRPPDAGRGAGAGRDENRSDAGRAGLEKSEPGSGRPVRDESPPDAGRGGGDTCSLRRTGRGIPKLPRRGFADAAEARGKDQKLREKTFGFTPRLLNDSQRGTMASAAAAMAMMSSISKNHPARRPSIPPF